MKAYQVWWRDQNNHTPVVVAGSYAEALKLAYEEIEVGLSEITNPTQCSYCENISDLPVGESCSCGEGVAEKL